MRRTCFFTTLMLALGISGCSYNPLNGNNHTTGTATGTATGAAVGATGAALIGGSKPVLGLGALAGGAAGYYFSTLRYDAGGIYREGGQVYQLGLYTGIYIPADQLFEPNTADFLPQAAPILDSAVVVLERQPNNNVMVVGNTSGFGRQKWEQKLSQERAGKIASYLWKAGINNFNDKSIDTKRKLNYVGYGHYFPIQSRLTNNGLRADNNIQITSYPSKEDLNIDSCDSTMQNMGAMKDGPGEAHPNCSFGRCG